jgi:hypothetical protein
MSEQRTSESALTCHECKTPVLYREIEGHPDMWWLEVPCIKCGSIRFDVRVDNPRAHMQIYGISV